MLVGITKQIGGRLLGKTGVGKQMAGISTGVNKYVGGAEKVGDIISSIPFIGGQLEQQYLNHGGRTAYNAVKKGQGIVNNPMGIMKSRKKSRKR